MASVFLLIGCGDDGTAQGEEGSASAEGTLGGTSIGDASGTSAPTSSDPDGGSSGSNTTPPTSGSSGDDGIKFDVGDTDGETGGVQGCGCGNDTWSYIWIANSPESTVSKINTRTLVEEGRYLTRPDANGNPSRTSVTIDGKAVAVANRSAGLVKIWARPELCDPMANGQPGLQTTDGPGNVLAFADEDCVAWFNDFGDMSVQRPVAWTTGVLNEETCEYDDQKVWTVTGQGGSPGSCGPNGLFVHLVNGDDGTIEQTVHIPEAEQPCGSLGAYGGAVDPDNNFWFYVWAQGKVVKVDYQTMNYVIYSGGMYGITVDTKGRPWVGDYPRRFDEQTQTWAQPVGMWQGAGGAGVAQDLQGRIWTAYSNGVGWIDMETMQVGDIVALPIQGLYRGISVDIDGYIWAVRLGGTEAFKIDPDDYTYEMVGGLNGPYTYSDMTGGQLSNVACNPEG